MLTPKLGGVGGREAKQKAVAKKARNEGELLTISVLEFMAHQG